MRPVLVAKRITTQLCVLPVMRANSFCASSSGMHPRDMTICASAHRLPRKNGSLGAVAPPSAGRCAVAAPPPPRGGIGGVGGDGRGSRGEKGGVRARAVCAALDAALGARETGAPVGLLRKGMRARA